MTPIPFLDLRAVYAPYVCEIKAAVEACVDSGRFVLGEQVQAFEREFADSCGVLHCVGAGNGLDALTILLQAAGFEPGDEVLVPANTYIATVLAVIRSGLRPVLVEPELATYIVDPERLAGQITSRTRAILAVHLYGQCADMAAIEQVAASHGLKVYEDAAQAHGASHADRRVGHLGVGAGFSFYPTKNLGALGDAGAITTDDGALAERCRASTNYGSLRKNVHVVLGGNSRLDEIQAAVLRVRLSHLQEENARRRVIARFYLDHIRHAAIALPSVRAWESHVWHLFVVRSRDRQALADHLLRRKIETAVHYPVPPHQQPALTGWFPGQFPLTEKIHREVLSLPLNPALTDGDVERIVEAVNCFPQES